HLISEHDKIKERVFCMGWRMTNDNQEKHDIIDEDLYEDLDEEELYELVEEARKEALAKAAARRRENQIKRPFAKWIFWLIALMLAFHMFALFPQSISVPIVDFLITSTKLSANENIAEYKQSVVVVETDDSRGTGFSFTEDGLIMTNYHVIEGEEQVIVAFEEEGLFHADVLERYPDIDLAILKPKTTETLPHLELAQETKFNKDEAIYFIGNPLKFNRIANEGNIIGYTGLKSWGKEVIMMEAPVYRGNSGSPVINMDGKVIGIVFATTNDEEFGKVGLFVPIDYYYEVKG